MNERRLYPRTEAAYEVFFIHGGKTSMARSFDISLKGIGLLLNEAADPGDPVELTIVPPEGMLNISLKGTVRYRIENPNAGNGTPQKYAAGIEFAEEAKQNFPFMEEGGEVTRYRASHTVAINAPADFCYRLMYDYERYLEWAGGFLKQVKIVSRRPDGRADKVEFVIDIFFRKVKYILNYSYDDANSTLFFKYAGGEVADVDGSYSFRRISDTSCSSTYELVVALDFNLPNRIINFFSSIAMRKAMKDFRKLAEQSFRESNSPAAHKADGA